MFVPFTSSVVSEGTGFLPAWECGSDRWQNLYAASRAFFEGKYQTSCSSAECMGEYRRLAETAARDGPVCPVADSVARLAHLGMTYERDVHGDWGKVAARPIELLHLPFSREVQLLTDVDGSLPRAAGSPWYELLFLLAGYLSKRICPGASDPDRRVPTSDYVAFCRERPWTIGCRLPLPSCDRPPAWRRTAAEILAHCWGVLPPLALAQCVRESLPESLPTRLDLLVPAQADEWLAVKNVLTLQHPNRDMMVVPPEVWGVPTRQPQRPPCVGATPATEYLPAALCPADGESAAWAPADGHFERIAVANGRLEAIVFGAVARALPGCGVEFEIHLHLDTPSAPGELHSCLGMACREQCASWEGGHYLRFACAFLADDQDPSKDVTVAATTFSGHASEPSLHTVITCRLPAMSFLPAWLWPANTGETPLEETGCPRSGLLDRGRCWYLSGLGAACGETCRAQGLDFSWLVAGGGANCADVIGPKPVQATRRLGPARMLRAGGGPVPHRKGSSRAQCRGQVSGGRLAVAAVQARLSLRDGCGSLFT